MTGIQSICPLCAKPVEDVQFAERICSLCGMSVGSISYYMFAGAGTQHYFCSSKCVKSYLIPKEV
jgi:YHS domain-containing protein